MLELELSRVARRAAEIFLPHWRYWGGGPLLNQALLLGGTRDCRDLIAAVTPGKILHLLEWQTKRRFLGDTVADFSIFPSKGPVVTTELLPN